MIKLLEDRRFYVYVFLDPLKPGKYKYDKYVFNYEPFYIGKGLNKRLDRSLFLYSDKSRNTFKMTKIRKLRNLGFKPITMKYTKFLTEQEAFNIEIDMIKTIGRRDKKLGPLTNLTDGGEGMSGHIVNKKTIDKNSGERNHNYGKPRSKKTRMKISESLKGNKNPMYGKHHSEETKTKISKKRKNYVGKRHPFYGRHHTLETIEKIKKSTKNKNMGCKNPNAKQVIVEYKYYDSIADAIRDNNISWQVINYRIRKNISGYRYLERNRDATMD